MTSATDHQTNTELTLLEYTPDVREIQLEGVPPQTMILIGRLKAGQENAGSSIYARIKPARDGENQPIGHELAIQDASGGYSDYHPSKTIFVVWPHGRWLSFIDPVIRMEHLSGRNEVEEDVLVGLLYAALKHVRTDPDIRFDADNVLNTMFEREQPFTPVHAYPHHGKRADDSDQGQVSTQLETTSLNYQKRVTGQHSLADPMEIEITDDEDENDEPGSLAALFDSPAASQDYDENGDAEPGPHMSTLDSSAATQELNVDPTPSVLAQIRAQLLRPTSPTANTESIMTESFVEPPTSAQQSVKGKEDMERFATGAMDSFKGWVEQTRHDAKDLPVVYKGRMEDLFRKQRELLESVLKESLEIS